MQGLQVFIDPAKYLVIAYPHCIGVIGLSNTLFHLTHKPFIMGLCIVWLVAQRSGFYRIGRHGYLAE